MNLTTYLLALKTHLDKLLSREPIYFPLSFVPRNTASRSAVTCSLTELVRLQPRLAILGPPGAGKTRAACELARTFCSNKERVPLYIPLRNLPPSPHPRSGYEWSELCVAVLNQELKGYCSFSTATDLEQVLRGQNLIILVDGLNEVSTDVRLTVLAALRTVPASAHVVLSSRIGEFPRIFKDWPVYHIRSLSFPDEVNGFISQTLLPSLAPKELSPAAYARVRREVLAKCEADVSLQQLATNPYLLSHLCAVACNGEELPDDRASLLKLVAANMISKHKQPLAEEEVTRVLADIAGEMQFEKRLHRITVEAAVNKSRGGIDDQELLKYLLDCLVGVRLFVLAKKSQQHSRYELQPGDSIEFQHAVFQEYFAGVYLYEKELHSKAAASVLRSLRRRGKSRGNWEAICTAVVLQTNAHGHVPMRVLLPLTATHPYLAALIQSEIPKRMMEGAEIEKLNEHLTTRLKRTAAFWALSMPHLYDWVPAVLLGIVVFFIGWAWPGEKSGVSLSALNASQEWPALVAVTLVMPIVYMAMLTAVYRWFDDAAFWRWVHPSLDALEVLRFRGGRRRLEELRQRARSHAFISEQMRGWILSTPVVPLTAVLDGVPKSRDDVTAEWVDYCFKRLSDPATEQAKCLLIIEALSAALRLLGVHDYSHMAIRERLKHYCDHGAPVRARLQIRAVLAAYQATRSKRPMRLSWAMVVSALIVVVCIGFFAFADYLPVPARLTRAVAGLAVAIAFLANCAELAKKLLPSSRKDGVGPWGN